MKKTLLIALLFLTAVTYAQQDAWVYFNDKPNAATYFANPLLMLSQRSLDRRTAQGIAIDIKDVPVSESYISQIELAVGVTVKAKSKWLNAVHVQGATADITALSLLTIVNHIDFADHSLNAASTDKPAAVEQTAAIAVATAVNQTLETLTTFNYGTSQSQIEMMNGQVLHQYNYTGTGKIIAIMDAGFPGVDTTQPFERLWNNDLILGGYNFVTANSNIYTGGTHGTTVLSTMGGYTEYQLIGTAPDASYYLFVTEDPLTEKPIEESLWVEAAEMADSLGVDVINTSLGYFTYDNPAYSYTYSQMNGVTSFMSRGADIAFSRGMIVVVSAGNTGNTTNSHIGVPADAINVLTVGAVNATEQYAAFSSIGPSFDGRVKPDVVAQGVSVVISNAAGAITSANGTSYAGPITAGLVTCLWEAQPDLTNAEIMAMVKGSASMFTAPNAQYGYGIPDFNFAFLSNASNTLDKNKIKVYPNPAENNLFFSFPTTIDAATVSLYNTLGQLVMEHKISSTSYVIPVGQLGSGVYMYKINSGNYTQTGKLIKK